MVLCKCQQFILFTKMPFAAKEGVGKCSSHAAFPEQQGPGGGATRMARGGIRLVHELTKSTLITYFSGMKVDPKYAFLHAYFLICLSCSFQNFSIWPKTHPFFPILHVFTPLNDVRAYSAWSWKTTLITWIFGRAWYPPLTFEWPPRAAGVEIRQALWPIPLKIWWGPTKCLDQRTKWPLKMFAYFNT